MISTTHRPSWALISCLTAFAWLTVWLATMRSLLGFFVVILLTIVSVAIFRMAWASVGYQVSLALQSVPNPMNSSDRVFDTACSNLLRTAHIRTLGGQRRVPRRRTIALSPTDLNQLLTGTPLAELQTIATVAYREQLTIAGLQDPQRSALVSIVALPGLGRGRYTIWDDNELALAVDDTSSANGGQRASSSAGHAGLRADGLGAADGDQREPDETREFNNDQTREMLMLSQLRVIVDGKLTFTEGRHPFTVGRDASCDIVLSSRNVSRVHARFEPTATGWLVTDAGSKHGLWVDETRMETFRVPPGVTILRLGAPVSAVTLQLQATPAVAVA